MLERSEPDRSQSIARARSFDGAEDAVDAFWRHYRRHGEPSRPAIECLTDLALSADPEQAGHGAALLFGEVVEPLCDAFSGRAAQAYRRLFAQVIAAARRHPRARTCTSATTRRGSTWPPHSASRR